MDDDSESIEVPITDSLDLHTYSPREVGELVPYYLDECVARGFAEVRIIHGKGIGALRERVHALLKRHPSVETFALAEETRGGWGATIVRLKTRRT
jgi:dsDNA-specific endonuclease/ATPase MutS2